MIKKLFPLFILMSFLVACGGAKKRGNYSFKNTTKKERVTHKPKPATVSPTAVNIIEIAQSYEGTPYKFGGTTKKGMDCSGLLYVSFKKAGIALPRTSREMSTRGNKITFQQIDKGDLLFFKTAKNRGINHVGLVVEVSAGKVFFIHASTSQGVMISSLDESYWFNAFAEARRVL